MIKNSTKIQGFAASETSRHSKNYIRFCQQLLELSAPVPNRKKTLKIPRSAFQSTSPPKSKRFMPVTCPTPQKNFVKIWR